jgi:hypothetical protein
MKAKTMKLKKKRFCSGHVRHKLKANSNILPGRYAEDGSVDMMSQKGIRTRPMDFVRGNCGRETLIKRHFRCVLLVLSEKIRGLVTILICHKVNDQEEAKKVIFDLWA